MDKEDNLQALDQDFRVWLEEMAQKEPDRQIPLVVTVAPETDFSELEELGFRIQQVFKEISSVSGTATAPQALRLAEPNQVQRIEYDGEMHAL